MCGLLGLLCPESRRTRTATHDVVAGRFDQVLGPGAIHGSHERNRGRCRSYEAPLAVDKAGIFQRNRQYARDDDGAAFEPAIGVGAAVETNRYSGKGLILRNHLGPPRALLAPTYATESRISATTSPQRESLAKPKLAVTAQAG